MDNSCTVYISSPSKLETKLKKDVGQVAVFYIYPWFQQVLTFS